MKSFYFLIFLILVSCADISKKPNLDVSKQRETLRTFEKIEYNWWQNFNDSALDKLVKIAILSNYDYKVAQNKIITARFNLLNKNSNFTSKDKDGFVLKNNNYFKFFDSQNKIPNYFLNGFDASWELDLFGSNDQSNQLAKALDKVSNDKKNYILVSLIAEVVENYSQIKAAQNDIIIEEKILKYCEEILKFNTKETKKLAYDNNLGVIKTEIINSNINLNEAKAKIIVLSKNLALLLDQNQNSLEKLLSENTNIPVLNDKVVFETPITILRNRPDIRNAEKELEVIPNLDNKAIDKIFPKISLTSFLGFNKKTENILQSSGIGISTPTLNFASIIADYKLSNQIEREALLNYKAKVLITFRDIESSLSNFIKEEEKFKFNEEKYALAQTISNLNKEEYLAGKISYSQYLDNEIDVLKVEKEKVNSKLKFFIKSVALYKSLGGGWEMEAFYLKENKNNLINKKRFKLAIASIPN